MGNTAGQGQPPISSCLHCLQYSFKGSKRGAHTAKLLLALEAATVQATGELVWANLHHVFLLCTMHQQQPLCSAWGTLGATGGKSTFCREPGESGPNALTCVCVWSLSCVLLFVIPWYQTPNLFIPLFPFGNHKFLFYVSVSVLYIDSFVLILDSTYK